MKLKKENILVTGGSGYIGSHIIKKFLSTGNFTVVSIDKKKTFNQKYNKDCTFIKGDIGDKDIVKKMLKKYKIDVVLHLAALISVEESMEKPDLYFKNNVLSSINLLEAMKEIGVNKMIFSSSAAVYGNPKNKLIREKDQINPSSIYGLTKMLFENILQYYNKNYNISSISFRMFNVAGADLSGELKEYHNPETHIIPKTIQSIIHNNPVAIYANNYSTPDGTCIRDYIHVSDVALAFLLALPKLENNICEIFNLGSGKKYSVKEVVNQCYALLNRKQKIVFKNRRPGDSVMLVSDNKKVKEALKWKPEYDLKDIILHTINSQR